MPPPVCHISRYHFVDAEQDTSCEYKWVRVIWILSYQQLYGILIQLERSLIVAAVKNTAVATGERERGCHANFVRGDVVDESGRKVLVAVGGLAPRRAVRDEGLQHVQGLGFVQRVFWLRPRTYRCDLLRPVRQSKAEREGEIVVSSIRGIETRVERLRCTDVHGVGVVRIELGVRVTQVGLGQVGRCIARIRQKSALGFGAWCTAVEAHLRSVYVVVMMNIVASSCLKVHGEGIFRVWAARRVFR